MTRRTYTPLPPVGTAQHLPLSVFLCVHSANENAAGEEHEDRWSGHRGGTVPRNRSGPGDARKVCCLRIEPAKMHMLVPRGGRLLGSGTRPPPLPPPPPCPPGPLSCQGSTATDHTYGGAKGDRKFFFSFPLPICPLCTPTLSLNATLTLMPTPTLSLLLTLPPKLTLDPNQD